MGFLQVLRCPATDQKLIGFPYESNLTPRAGVRVNLCMVTYLKLLLAFLQFFGFVHLQNAAQRSFTHAALEG